MNQRQVTLFCKLAIIWIVIALGESFRVRTPKCRLTINTVRLAVNDHLEASDSIYVIMGLRPKDLQNVATMISTIRLAETDHPEACESSLQVGHLLRRNKVK